MNSGDPLSHWVSEISMAMRRSSALAVGVLSTDGQLLFANHCLLQLLGGNNKQPPDLHWLINPILNKLLAHPIDNEILYSGWFTFGGPIGPYRSVFGQARKKGDEVLVLAEYDTQELASAAQQLIELNGEITNLQRDLVLANTKQNQILEALRAEGERYRSVVEDQLELICRFNPRGELTFVNSVYARFVGQTTEKVTQRDLTSAALVMLPTGFSELIVKLTPENPVTTFEQNLNDSEGVEHVLQWTCRALFNLSGRIIEYQAVGRDRTEQKRIEAERKQLALERERAQLLSNFVRDVSHDLNTPLTILSTSLYLLPKMTDRARQSERIAVMEKQIERLKTLLSQALAMTELDSSSMKFAPTDINEIVAAVAANAQAQAEKLRLQLGTDLEPCSEFFAVDQERLRQAITHIVDNALKFTPASGSIILRTRFGAAVVIEVEDTGIGIEADDLHHIFERFYRSDRARSAETGGSGMGLAIVKRIADLHQGQVMATSVPGQGSVFRLTLPLIQPG